MHRTGPWRALGGALILLAAASAAATAADPPVTLRFAVADDEYRPSDPYVRAFADEVKARSGGSVTVDIHWSAGDGTDLGFEQGVASLVTSGAADVGLAAGRGWSGAGNHALDALQTPFLITSDPLAVAVATDPLATDLLAGMASGGVTGLALWPEDLRHPVAFVPCIPAIRSPEQLQGAVMRFIPSPISSELAVALGVTEFNGDGYDGKVARCEVQAAESGLRQGASLAGHPTFTSDVAFYPKFQVLAVNSVTFAALTAAQQDAVRAAALAVRDRALAERPTDADAAAAWCADGGTVVTAGPSGVAAFEAVGKPIADRLAQDPATGRAIEAIRALRSALGAPPPVPTCSPIPRADAGPIDTVGFSAAPIPSGTYRYAVTVDDLVEAGATKAYAANNAGAWTYTIDGDHWSVAGMSGTKLRQCSGTLQPAGSVVQFRTTDDRGCGSDMDIVWRETGDGIEPRIVSIPGVTDPYDLASSRAETQRLWLRLDGSPSPSPAAITSSLPTVGTWRIDHGADAILLTFDGTRWTGLRTCGGTYALQPDGHLHLFYELDPASCGTGGVDLAWIQDGPDLAHVVTTSTDRDDRHVFNGDWIRID
ncbi:MAG: hypothetical protein U0869_02625 [Chloroflexota bacterium]